MTDLLQSIAIIALGVACLLNARTLLRMQHLIRSLLAALQHGITVSMHEISRRAASEEVSAPTPHDETYYN